jgi:hypothetical protein
MTVSGAICRFAVVVAVLSLSAPAGAQGKNQQSHGNNGQGKPSESVLPAPTVSAGATPSAAAPFAWVDNAALMPAGLVWVGFSMTRWQGGGLGETNIPVVDAAVGLTPRVQFSASVPRVTDPSGTGGALGTTFFSTKIAAFSDEKRSLALAVAPTIEILGSAAMVAAPDGRSRTQIGVPVSLDVERNSTHFYGSLGYFSPGIWFTGAGAGKMIGTWTGIAVSFSRAWSSPTDAIDPALIGPRRNDLSGSVSVDLTPHVGLYGSIGHTIATSDENGAGTTISIGVSLTAGPMSFVQ